MTPPLIKVVIADDLPQIRAVLRRALEKDGRFEVLGDATTGNEAIQMASTLRPDALVLDLAMPGMDGMEAIPQILFSAPGTKIVVLSGFVEMAADVLKAGAHGFFEKTAPPQELAATIVELVARDN